jgi:hypothetical protein
MLVFIIALAGVHPATAKYGERQAGRDENEDH